MRAGRRARAESACRPPAKGACGGVWRHRQRRGRGRFRGDGRALPGDTYQSALYENPGNGNHWISLELQGVKANRSAVGARLDVAVREKGGSLRHIYRTVGYQSSFGGNPLRQHIGIGGAGGVEMLEVRWPASGLVQRFRGVSGDRAYRLREGGELRPAGYPRYRFPSTAKQAHLNAGAESGGGAVRDVQRQRGVKQ
jgi:hypothetical protein